jgi:hypothetical protein
LGATGVRRRSGPASVSIANRNAEIAGAPAAPLLKPVVEIVD